jgi:peptidoglycan/xylan/chitin deacetylase (PgdA/CDA1 family)
VKFTDLVEIAYIRFIMHNHGKSLPIFMPFYHAVEEEPRAYQRPWYRVPTPAEFEAELETMLKQYEPVSFAEMLHLKQQGRKQKQGKPLMVLSFDDGLQSIYRHVFPLLQRKGVPAICFVNAAFFNNQALFYRYKVGLLWHHMQINQSACKLLEQSHLFAGQNLTSPEFWQSLSHSHEAQIDEAMALVGIDLTEFMETEQPYMTLEQLKQLHDAGFEIGSHGHNHWRYAALTADERLADYQKGLAFIKKHFQPQHLLFAFPFTDAGLTSEDIEQLLAPYGADYLFGCAGLKHEVPPRHFQRVPMDDYKHHPDALRKMRNRYRIKKLIGRHVVSRR